MIVNGRRQLRAYVQPENVGLSEGSILTPPQPARFNVPGIGMMVKNTGQTPAYDVVSWGQIAIIQITQEDIALRVPSTIEQRFPHTLGSGCTFTKALWHDRALTPPEIADILAGTRAIYYFGRIEYLDAFKKPHHTNFRLRYTGLFPPLPNVIFNFCEEGNDSD